MDVERIQKINNLALNLMNQGLAADREEAISQAEKVFSAKDSQAYNEMRETMRVGTPQATKEVLSADKISEILSKNTQYIVGQLKGFSAKIAHLEQELQRIQQNMMYPAAERIIVSQKTAPTVSEVVAQTPEPKVAPVHPRSGNFVEDDVSIEKFFYMGSK